MLAWRESPSTSSGGTELAITASSSQWTAIGPQPTNSPYPFGLTSGRVSALAVDPRNSNVVYLGGAQGGVWKTTDGGQTWTPLTDTQASLAVGSIALDPSNPVVVYVGTGEENFSGDSYYGAGILKSTDAGATWTQIPGPFAGPFSATSIPSAAHIGDLAVHPTNGQIILAAVGNVLPGTKRGVYRSVDGGQTWTQTLNTSGASVTGVVFDPTNGNNAFAVAILRGFYKSTDAGQTWNLANGTGSNVLPSTNVGRIALAIDPSNPTTLYAGIANQTDSTLLGLFKTTDAGNNWTQLTTTPPYCAPTGGNAQCNYDNVVRVDPVNSNVIYVGGSGRGVGVGVLLTSTLFRSLDGGTKWLDISTGATGGGLHPDLHAIAFASDGSKVYVGNDGGTWSTSDVAVNTVNWTNLNGALAITQFHPGLSIHPSDINTGFGGTQDNGTERYTGNLAWDNVTCGDGGWTAIDFMTPSTIYATCQQIDIRKSTTGGAFGSWVQGMTSGINSKDRVSFIPPLVMDPSNSQSLYFGTFVVYQSRDGANSWTAISPDLTGGGTLTTIAVAPSDANTVYAGSSDSHVQVRTDAVAGGTGGWTDVSLGLPPRFVTQIAVDPTSAKVAYVTFSGFSGFGGDVLGHAFKTINGGSSWTDISGNLPNIPVNDIEVDADIPNTLYAATDVGVFRSSDGGATWSPLVTGLPRVAVLGLKLHRPSRTLRAATHGRSMWDVIVPTGGSSVGFSPASLSFGSQTVGTTSAAQTVTLTNSGSGPLTITGISITGTNSADFGQTNACGNSLAAGSSCAINVTFQPTGVKTRTATLTITDNAATSPQSVPLSGMGADFSLSSSPTSAAVTAGSSANYTLTLTPAGGFSQPVSLFCSGAPTQANCTVSPVTVTLNGSTASTATVTVTTTARSTTRPRPYFPYPPVAGGYWQVNLILWILGLLTLTSVVAPWRADQTKGDGRLYLGIAGLVLALSFGAAACGGGGGGGSNFSSNGGGTPAGTYSLTTTASASSVSHTATLTLTVN